MEREASMPRDQRSKKRTFKNKKEEVLHMGRTVLNLPDATVQRASSLFEAVVSLNPFWRRRLNAVAAACIYIACREAKSALCTFKNIVKASNSKSRLINTCFKVITKNLDLKMEAPSVPIYIQGFYISLGICIVTRNNALYISARALRLKIVPNELILPLAASAIFIAVQATGRKVSAKEITKMVGIGVTGTYKRVYRMLYPRLSEILPPSLSLGRMLILLPLP